MYKCTVLLQNGLCLMFIVGNIGLMKHFVTQDMCSLNNHVYYYIKLLVACYKAESLLHDKLLVTCYKANYLSHLMTSKHLLHDKLLSIFKSSYFMDKRYAI